MDVKRLLPPNSPFLRFPGEEDKQERKESSPLVSGEAKQSENDDQPLPTCPFPKEFYESNLWKEAPKLKFDWEEGGPICTYMEAPIFTEMEGVRASIGGGVRKAIKKRPRRLLPGHFLAFASSDPGAAFFVGRIRSIRCHTLWIHFFGDKFLGMRLIFELLFT